MWHDQGKWVACRRFFNFEISTPLSGNSKMLHFNANPITIGYLVTELWAIYKRWKQYKSKEFECFLCLYLKCNICDIRLIPLDHVTYMIIHFIYMTEVHKLWANLIIHSMFLQLYVFDHRPWSMVWLMIGEVYECVQSNKCKLLNI